MFASNPVYSSNIHGNPMEGAKKMEKVGDGNHLGVVVPRAAEIHVAHAVVVEALSGKSAYHVACFTFRAAGKN